MKALHASACVLALGLVAGCGASGSSAGGTATVKPATVQGSGPAAARPLDNARAIAVGANGRVFWANLDARGAFTLKLPVGESYRVLIANALATGARRTIGHLVIHPSAGATRWMGIHQSGTIALGALTVPGAAPAASAGGTLTTKDDQHAGESSSSGSDSGSDKEDLDTHEDDGQTGTLCSSQGSGEQDDQELDASDDPGDKCSDDHQSEHQSDAQSEHESNADGGEHESNADGGEHESDDDGAPCLPSDAGSGGGSSGSSSGSPSGSGSGGGTPPGGTCTVTANCAAGLACVGSICQPPVL